MASAMDRRFDLEEQKVRQQENAKAQMEKEALQRRFAAIGSLGSGASIKAEQLTDQAAARRMQEGMTNVSQARLAEQARQEEIKGQREYQTSERVGGQEYGTSERIGAQNFATAKATTDWNRQVQEADKQRGFLGAQSELERGFKTAESNKAAQLAVQLQNMKDVISNKEINLAIKDQQISEIVSFFNMGNADAMNSLISKLYGDAYRTDKPQPIVDRSVGAKNIGGYYGGAGR